MHLTAYQFACNALTGADVTGRVVFEAGAYDVNGSVRGHAESLSPASYTGTDMRNGPGVDVVLDAADLPSLGQAGVVICTEMLEHAADWQAAMTGLIDALEPGGLLVITTRSAGFPVHGYPDDHWRYPVDVMGEIVAAAGLTIVFLGPDLPSDPGVFCTARKPAGWAWPQGCQAAWDGAQVQKAGA